MDKLIKILSQLLEMQAQLDAMIKYKTKSNSVVNKFFKQSNNLGNLYDIYDSVSRAIDSLNKDFQKHILLQEIKR